MLKAPQLIFEFGLLPRADKQGWVRAAAHGHEARARRGPRESYIRIGDDLDLVPRSLRSAVSSTHDSISAPDRKRGAERQASAKICEGSAGRSASCGAKETLHQQSSRTTAAERSQCSSSGPRLELIERGA